jgi:hypothetical protein
LAHEAERQWSNCRPLAALDASPCRTALAVRLSFPQSES